MRPRDGGRHVVDPAPVTQDHRVAKALVVMRGRHVHREVRHRGPILMAETNTRTSLVMPLPGHRQDGGERQEQRDRPANRFDYGLVQGVGETPAGRSCAGAGVQSGGAVGATAREAVLAVKPRGSH